MSQEDIEEMGRKIDEGILRAQERLIERARHDNSSLVIARDGIVVEISASDL